MSLKSDRANATPLQLPMRSHKPMTIPIPEDRFVTIRQAIAILIMILPLAKARSLQKQLQKFEDSGLWDINQLSIAKRSF